MELKIKSMHLKNFMGVTDKTINFDGNTKVLGANAQGKTTLATAFYWLFADCNTALVKNPPITPMGATECESRVEIECLIDDKPIQLAKSQKFKVKEVDGKITSSAPNSYEINSVSKAYKDFVKELSDRGIPMDNFLIFSHPFGFMADSSKTGREKMRSLLFEMCEDITDAEIAKEMTNADELTALLENYKIDEIEQMNKSTVKKITDTMGKDNSIVNARIDELISQKSTQDEKVLIEQKSNYESEIERIEKNLADLSSSKADISKKITNFKIKRDNLVNDANSELTNKKYEIDKKYRTIQSALNEHSWQLKMAQAEKKRLEENLSNLNEDLKKQRTLYKTEQGSRLDESDRYCPTCHREFEPDKLKKIKDDFEKRKAERLKVIKTSGDNLNTEIKDLNKQIADVDKKIINYEKLVDETNKEFESVKAQISMLPGVVDLSANKEYSELTKQITELEAELVTDDNALIEELTSQKNVNKQMLNQVNGELAVLEKNKDLDNRINELREERRKAEINKAQAEKLIDLVAKFKMFKNSKLSEVINSYFENVSFKFFKILKNGNIEETLEILIDGKEINTQVNQASQVLAKLGIIKGLSDYHKVWLPVFCDDFALITSESDKKINMKNQLVKLIAADGVSGLKVEGE
jgi:hypothetical protein